MKFRSRPPGVVEGAVGPGTLDLPAACARAKGLATRPLKFTLTGPHMLAKMLLDNHYKRQGGAGAWRSPTCWPNRSSISTPK